MISFLLDTVLYTGVWVVKTSYNGIYYMVNGHQETTEERLEKLILENKEQQVELKSLIEELKNNKQTNQE